MGYRKTTPREANNPQLDYWNVNVPECERTTECPDFLRDISDKDRGIIATPDSEYTRMGWDEVRQLASKNQLSMFYRVPSELRLYKAFLSDLKQRYGGVGDYILKEKLHWELPLEAKGRPFEFWEDVSILPNDWPYAIDRRIRHMVVWTKFTLVEDPETGLLTEEATQQIENFVSRVFCNRIPRDQVRSGIV